MVFLFRLEMTDGEPAEPSMLEAAVPNWRPGDTIPLGGQCCAWSSTTVELTSRTFPRPPRPNVRKPG